jgi:hypothetical protein
VPRIDGFRFVLLIVVPYLVVVVISYVGARVTR